MSEQLQALVVMASYFGVLAGWLLTDEAIKWWKRWR